MRYPPPAYPPATMRHLAALLACATLTACQEVGATSPATPHTSAFTGEAADEATPWPFVEPTLVAHRMPGAPSIRGAAIPDEDTVWLSGSGGLVARSDDRGRTFLVVSPPDTTELDFRAIVAFDAERAFALSAGPAEASQLHATRDGGATWEQVLVNTHAEGFWDGLAFWNETHGILLGDPVDGSLFVLTTADGGLTWTRTAPDSLPATAQLTLVEEGVDVEIGEYCFAASNQSLAMGANGQAWLGTGGAQARIWRTADWGATWKAHPTPLTAADPASGVFALDVPEPRAGVAVGGKYDAPTSGATAGVTTAAYTRDGGATWRAADPGPAGYRSSVRRLPRAFAEAEHEAGDRTQADLWGLPEFVAVGTSGISLARKGGREWAELEGAPEGLNVLATSPSGRTVIAAGRDGLVVRLEF